MHTLLGHRLHKAQYGEQLLEWEEGTHEVIRKLNEEDLHIYDVNLVGNLHDHVLGFDVVDPPRCGGSKLGKTPNITHGRVEGHGHWMKDYFVENPIYDAKIFHQRFRILKLLFLKQIVNVENYDLYFVH